MSKYTVIGQPIAHSLSPQIHQVFASLTHRSIQYTRTESSVEDFSDTLDRFQRNGGQGCNVTVPFKQLAVMHCHNLDASASVAGAVNTILMHEDGSRVGHNTDGSGLCADLESNIQFLIESKRVLILGAGGATRGILGPLLSRNPTQIAIANRTESKALELADTFKNHGSVRGSSFQSIKELGEFDLVLNATSMSLQGESPPLTESTFAADALAYDLMYAKSDTQFMTLSRTLGASNICNGFGMLVEQAADAFLIWEGVRPDTRLAYPELLSLITS